MKIGRARKTYAVADFLRDFDWAAKDFCMERGRPFENFPHGASGHFHQRLIEIVRGQGGFPSRWIERESYFIELLYAVLAAWGMDSQKARLVDFSDFQKAVVHLVSSPTLRALEDEQVQSVTEGWRDQLHELWQVLSGEGRIMASGSILVGSSKLLHHLLPDLFPPIDRTYTLGLLQHLDKREPYRISVGDSQQPAFEVFYKTMLFFCHVSRSVPSIESYLGQGPMSGSIPKVIDNAVIAWWGTP